MKIKHLSFLTTILLLFTLTGCFGGNNINSILFPISMGIEYNNGTYKVLYQIIDPSVTSTIDLESSKDMVPVSIITGEGSSLYEASQNIDYNGNKVISYNHIRSMIISKSLIDDADEPFNNILFNFIGDPQFRKNAFIYVSDNNIANIYKTIQSSGLTPFYSLFNTPKQSSISNIIKPITLIETAANYIDNYRTTYFPFIGLEFNEEGVTDETTSILKVILKGSCYSHNEVELEIVCLNNDQIEGYKWFQNINDVVINAFNNEIDIKAKVNNTTSTISYENEQALININVDLAILYDYTNINILDISTLFANKISAQVKNTYQIAYNQGLDIYNLIDYVRRYHNKQYTLTSEIIVDVNVNINTKVLYS